MRCGRYGCLLLFVAAPGGEVEQGEDKERPEDGGVVEGVEYGQGDGDGEVGGEQRPGARADAQRAAVGGRDVFGAARGAATGDVGEDVCSDFRRWLHLFIHGAQFGGEFAVRVNAVGQFAAQAALHEVEKFGVVVFDGAGNGVVVRQAGTDDAGNVARDGCATGGVGADGAAVAVAVGEGEQFVVVAGVGVNVIQFRPRYGEVQFAAAEVAVEVDVVEVALARFGEGKVQAVRVAAGDGAGRAGKGAPEEAGGAEGEDGGDEAEGEGGVAAAVHPEVGQVLREDTGGEEQPPAEPVGAGDGARGAVPRAQRDVRARGGRAGGWRFAVVGLFLPAALSRPPGDSDRDERCEGGKSGGNAARQWPVQQHEAGGKEEQAIGEVEPGKRAAARWRQRGVVR